MHRRIAPPHISSPCVQQPPPSTRFTRTRALMARQLNPGGTTPAAGKSRERAPTAASLPGPPLTRHIVSGGTAEMHKARDTHKRIPYPVRAHHTLIFGLTCGVCVRAHTRVAPSSADDAWPWNDAPLGTGALPFVFFRPRILSHLLVHITDALWWWYRR
jgi:hypothetical protein